MINHKLPLALVTGATGLVGSHLIAALIQHGYPVRAMKRKTSNLSQFNYIMSYYKLDSETLSDRKSTRLNSSHIQNTYAAFSL